MCRVPQELVDVILDYVDDDIHALGNCGLVCHNWLPSARSHIFYEVELSYSRPSRVTSAVEILERSPEIALAVRSIRITADSQTESSLGEVSKILCSFTRLDELHLSCIAPHEETDSDLTTFVKSLAAVTPTVKVISMYAVSFNTFGCFSHFLRAFPLLSHLDLHTVSFPGNSAASPAFDSLEGHIPRIKIIHLSLCDAAAQMVEMLLDRDRIHLEASGSVALFCHIEPEVFPYLKLIENLGARIYNLELSLGTSIEGVSAAEMCHGQQDNVSNLNKSKSLHHFSRLSFPFTMYLSEDLFIGGGARGPR